MGTLQAVDPASYVAPLVDALSEQPEVRAVTLVGSHITGFANDASDVDVWVYIDAEASGMLPERRAIIEPLADPGAAKIVGQLAHPTADVFMPHGGDAWIDVMYWSTGWAHEELDWRLVKHEPQVGYSTGLWRALRDGVRLFARDDWHAEMQKRAASPYPDVLRQRIIELNGDLIGPANPFSFLHQTDRAVTEGDAVAIQHRATKWLASYFDVLFAANRVLTPGEKRLVQFAVRECAAVPDGLAEDVNRLVGVSCTASQELTAQMHAMLERLGELLDPHH